MGSNLRDLVISRGDADHSPNFLVGVLERIGIATLRYLRFNRGDPEDSQNFLA